MVVKLNLFSFIICNRFESSVIPYGSKTSAHAKTSSASFESSVIPYGSKTGKRYRCNKIRFESSVIPYGSKTC